MIALEIFFNGEKQFTAAGDYETLATALTRIRTAPDEYALIFNTSGIEPDPLTIAHWPDCEVKIGDRIEIRVVEAASSDPPAQIDTNAGKEIES
jgi:hypothetical protein